MTTTIRFCDGAESQDLSWAIAVVNSPINFTGTPKTGSRCYLLATLASITFPIAPNGLLSGSTATTDDHIVVAFGLRFTDKVPSADVEMFTIAEGGTTVLSLTLTTGSDWELRDHAGTLLDTITDPFTVDEYDFVQIYFEHVGSSADWDIVINGSSVSSGSTGDFLASGDVDRFTFSADNTSIHFRWDDIHVLTDDTAKPTLLGPAEVLAFQAGSGATETGALDTGDPTYIDELPFSDGGGTDEIEISRSGGSSWSVECDAAGEGAAGPRSNADIDGDGNIKLVVWHHQLKRTNGGSPTSMNTLHGNDTDTLVVNNVASALTTGYQDFFRTSDDASVAMPLSTEDIEYGISIEGGSGGRDIFCSGIFAQLLHVPGAGGGLATVDNLFINRAVQRAANF